jgi:hypothetical protein
MSSRRKIEDHALAKGTSPHVLAGACVHNDWQTGQELDEPDYEVGVADFLSQPFDKGSPQLTDEAAQRVLARVRTQNAEAASFMNAVWSPALNLASSLPREHQAGMMAAARREADEMRRRHATEIKAAAKGEE